MKRVRWLWMRVRAMELHEVLLRIWREAVKRAVWIRRRGARIAASADPARGQTPTLPIRQGARVSAAMRIAEKYIAGRVDLLGTEYRVPWPVPWTTDLDSGITAPASRAFAIDHRDVALVGDVKIVWELNRHHHLVTLALAELGSRDGRFRSRIEADLDSWMMLNPPFVGINWTHPLEAAIRLICWTWTDRILGYAGHTLRISPEMREAIWSQQWFVRNFLSVGTSANNHRIGELAGLLISTMAWPGLPHARAWSQWALPRLEASLLEQTFPSGFNREMAFPYHQFVLEFAALALIELRLRGADSPKIRDVTERMVQVLCKVSPIFPRFGDGDEGHVLGPPPGASYPEYTKDLGRLATELDPPTHEALGEFFSGWTAAARCAGTHTGFVARDAGFVRLVSRTDQGRVITADVDCGPHGYLAIAAHGHADALSVVFAVDDQPVLVDPGTYAYHTDPQWRRYFRSTEAHNTVEIGGRDQALQYGPFEWASSPEVELLEVEIRDHRGGRVVGSHDGYRDLGVIHERSVDLTSGALRVEDRLTGPGDQSFRVHYHLHPAITARRVGDRKMVLSAGNTDLVALDFDGPGTIQTVVGGDRLGWYSRQLHRKEPTTTIVVEGTTATTEVTRMNAFFLC